jgi:DNA-binding SARP family transcriptional activator/tetratricopeptide (TPR) repeat protein
VVKRPGVRGDGGIRVELLGGFRLRAQGQVVDRGLTARQQHLLAYLLLHSHLPISRAQLAGRFWPDSTEAQALTNLRRELHHARHAVPELESALDAGPRTIALTMTAGLEFDVADFEREAGCGLQGDKAALTRAADLYQGDLLPDCHGEWIGPLRDRLQARVVEVLAASIDLLERGHSYAAAIDRAQQLLRIDPVHEATWRALMRCHAHRGERASALHVFHRCATTFKRELGVQPSAATRMAYRELLDLEDAVSAGAPSLPAAGLFPLVGRAQSWAALLQAWDVSARGRAHVALIRGEAGIGKSRLAEELIDWARQAGIRLGATRCYAGEGRLAYAPLADWLHSDGIRPALASLDPPWRAEVSRLHPVAGDASTNDDARAIEPWQRPRFFEGMARAFQSVTPLLLVLDDLQWCDPDTLEWLHFFVRFAGEAPCLVVGTVRSEEEADNRGLDLFVRGVERLDRLTLIELAPLDERASATLAESVAGHPLDAETTSRVFRHSEGHPLFIVETGRIEGALEDVAPGAALPPRVQGVVAHRLALLSPDARSCAELAATIGRDFSFEVLSHASDLEEGALVAAMDELWRRNIVRTRDSNLWDFSHDRIREVTYASIGPARRRLLHRRIAQSLELLHASDIDTVSAAIAGHLEQTEHAGRAVEFLTRAARAAMRLSANEEAIRCLSRAIALLDRLPAGEERHGREIDLRAMLAGPIVAARGYAVAEAETNLERLVSLASEVNVGDPLVEYLCGLWSVRFVRGNMRLARQVVDRIRAIEAPRPERAWYFHHACAGQHVSVGELELSRRHYDACMVAAGVTRSQLSMLGSDYGVFPRAWSAHVLWLLGYVDEARERAEEAIRLAEQLEHPYSLTLALSYAAVLFQFRREPEKVDEYATQVASLCDRYRFAYYGAWASILKGWVCVQQGDAGGGIERISTGLAGMDQQQSQTRRPYYLSLLAEAHLASGDRSRAASILDTALAIADDHDDQWWTAELHRLRGELSDAREAEHCFQRALEVADAQGSICLRLRAALSYAQLARTVHDRTDNAALLVSIVNAFPQPGDSREVRLARETLARS